MNQKPVLDNGLFIVLEGPEGAGKSSLARHLRFELERDGYEVVLTREPGGSPGAERIRELLLTSTGETEDWHGRTEMFLFAAARTQHVEATIKPALERGAIVVCDRWVWSTIAYQGYGRGQNKETIATLSHIAADGLAPDLTILVDVPPEVGLARSLKRLGTEGSKEDRFENLELEFHRRVRTGFLALAWDGPEGEEVELIDGTREPEEVQKLALRAVRRIEMRARAAQEDAENLEP